MKTGIQMAGSMRTVIHVLSIVVTLLLVTGCSTPRWGVGKGVMPMPRADVAVASSEYYDYPKVAESADLVDRVEGRGWVRDRYERQLGVPDHLDATQWQKSEALEDKLSDRDRHLATTLRVDLYRPPTVEPDQRLPVILLSPILGGTMIVDGFAKYYARNGFVAALVDRPLPHHAVDLPLSQVEDYLRLNVMRLRQAIDLIEQLSYVDTEKIGAFGVSYGGIIHVTAGAVEPRIRYQVVALAAGDLPAVMVESKDGGLSDRMTAVREYNGWTADETRDQLSRVIRSDPKKLAQALDPASFSMYVARFDRVVGTRHSVDLWRAVGCPKLRVIPLGHYTSILATPIMKRQSVRDFRDAFAIKSK